MNKSAILGLVCAAFVSQPVLAQSAQEVTYVEDAAQGYTFNRFKDNWFISAEGGVNLFFSSHDSKMDLTDRLAPNASLWVGKWFSPIIGARLGVNFTQIKSLTPNGGDPGVLRGDMVDAYYKQKRNMIAPSVDLMLNLTNWWCGYRPGRVYNATIYGGGGVVLPFYPKYDKSGNRDGWDMNEKQLTAHAGLINNFNVSKHCALYLDLRYAVYTEPSNEKGAHHTLNNDVQAYIGFTYNFNKTTWAAPVVPVCPPAQNCDAVEARLQAANARISDLERQLKDCLSRPVEVKEVKAEGPLTTIYYVINGTRLSRVDRKVLGAVAEVMKANPDKKYEVTGWADNYTGTAAVNDRVRTARAKGVEKALLGYGVNPAQLIVNTNNENLNDMGDKYVALDRAVTIKVAE